LGSILEVVGSEGNFAFRVGNRVHTWLQQTSMWTPGPLYGAGAVVDLIGSGGNFAAEITNKVDAWNRATNGWTVSPQVTSGSIVEVIGSGGNFAFRVGNRAYAWSAQDSSWYASSTYSGFQELIGSGANFAIRLSNSIYPYDDATHGWGSTSISGVSAVTGAPVPPCTSGSCSDENTCTTDTCNLELGCEYIDNTDPCDDGDACTEADECSGGVCQPGGPLDCDDQDACTADACDDLVGCTHDPIPGCGAAAVPSGSVWGRALLGLLLAGAGASLLRTQRARFSRESAAGDKPLRRPRRRGSCRS
jgi:hypothetical protein